VLTCVRFYYKSPCLWFHITTT